MELPEIEKPDPEVEKQDGDGEYAGITRRDTRVAISMEMLRQGRTAKDIEEMIKALEAVVFADEN